MSRVQGRWGVGRERGTCTDLGWHDLGVGARDLDSSVQACAVVRLHDVPSEHVARADRAVVGALGTRKAALGPPQRVAVWAEQRVLLFDSEPRHGFLVWWKDTICTLTQSEILGKTKEKRATVLLVLVFLAPRWANESNTFTLQTCHGTMLRSVFTDHFVRVYNCLASSGSNVEQSRTDVIMQHIAATSNMALVRVTSVNFLMKKWKKGIEKTQTRLNDFQTHLNAFAFFPIPSFNQEGHIYPSNSQCNIALRQLARQCCSDYLACAVSERNTRIVWCLVRCSAG